MPSRSNNIEYAFYAISEVESGWNWSSVNFNDPITVGIMQDYAYNAARVLRACKAGDPGWTAFAQAAPRIAGYVDTLNDQQWTTVYLTQAEGNAWVQMSQSAENHAIQSADARQQMGGYIDLLTSQYGLSNDQPQVLVFACAMYHQSPAQCIKVLGRCSGRATLDYIHQTCLNDGILGRYRNRYDKVYARLKAWDGESAPPDFGAAGGEYYSGQETGGQTSASVSVSRIYAAQGRVVIFGTGYEQGIQCYETTPGNWVPSRQNVTSGSNVTPGWSGGGSGDLKAALDLYDSWERDYDFAYSQGGGRLNLPASGASDCSGSIWCAFNQATGKDVGTWTGSMCDGRNVLIAEGTVGNFTAADYAKLQPGDLIVFSNSSDWANASSHVELFMGPDYTQDLLGGGSAPVPHYKDCMNYMNSTQGYFRMWRVYRVK